MKYGDEEIGGKHIDHTNMRFSGDEEMARAYIPIARNLLGTLKHQMQFNQLDQLRHQVQLSDGTIIQVASAKGTSDSDRITIYSPNVQKPKKNVQRRCIGYIVQAFTTEGFNPVEQYYDFKLITPSGKRLGYNANFESGSVKSWSELQGEVINGGTKESVLADAWPNNGALYWPRQYYDAGTNTWSASDYEEVISRGYAYLIDNTGLGPVVYTITGIDPNPFESMFVPPYTATYTFDSANYATPDFGTFTSGTVDSSLTDVENATIITDWYNDTNAAGYLYDLEQTYFDSAQWFYDIVLQFPNEFEIHLFRHKDGYGLISQSGLELNNGNLKLHERAEDISNNQYGDGFIYMIDTPRRIFSWSTQIQTDNGYSDNWSFNQTNVGLYLNSTVDYDPHSAHPPLPSITGYVTTNQDTTNLVSDQVQDYELATAFGIPCVVEDGTHKINIRRTVIENNVMKVKVWLLMEDEGFKYVTFDNQAFPGTYEWDKQIHIKVGYLPDGIYPESLVSLIDHTPVA